MLQGSDPRSRAALILLLFVAGSSLGCFAHSRGEMDWDDNPVVNTGTGATILYPGQSAPTYYPPSQTPAPQTSPTPAPQPSGTAVVPGSGSAPGSGSLGGAPTTQTLPTGERRSGGAQPGGTPITMIGGTEQENEGHLSWKQEPAWEKYLMLPFALIAAPFKALAREPEPGPAIPTTPPVSLGTPPPPAPTVRADEPRVDYETEQMQALERELEQRRASQGAPTPSAAPQAAQTRFGGAGSSIAEELAALKRRSAEVPIAPVPAPSTAAAPSAPRATVAAQPAPGRRADGRVDRDQDGRVDQWIYRDGDRIDRVELDENRDGAPDRFVTYDAATNEIGQVAEDVNADGTPDSWTFYEGGRIARRRSDQNFDGTIDTWAFYRDGVITRHERDTNGDGFRDRVGRYEAGKLVREEQDRDGDGRPDATIDYDASERVSRREEDNDHDGRPDVVSYYEAGRLARRELLHHADPPESATP